MVLWLCLVPILLRDAVGGWAGAFERADIDYLSIEVDEVPYILRVVFEVVEHAVVLGEELE